MALRKLNYVPNAVATTFRTGRSPVIGIAVPDIVDPFFAAIAKAVEAGSRREHGMSTVVTSLGEDLQEEADVVGRLLSQSLSGLDHRPRRRRARLPRSRGRCRPADRVRRPHAGAGWRRTRSPRTTTAARTWPRGTCVDHGHRRIAFISDTPDLPTSHSRLLGYRAALAEAGIGENPDYEVFGALDRDSAAGVLRKLTELAEPPDRDHVLERPVHDGARARAARPPLAVVGFGDFPMADMLEPAMTVIDQDPYALGTLAAQRVLRPARAPGASLPPRTVLPVTLVERTSCRRAP